MAGTIGPRAFFARRALLPDGRVGRSVTIACDDGRITQVDEGADRDSAEALPGLVIPGLANAHSHAFHRALRARTEAGAGSFWAWREAMYRVAARLEPDSYLRLGRAVYAEMALAGVTAVGEFHYVHHRPSGRPYADPNAMGDAVAEAAAQAGIRITLLDTCYLAGGFGKPLEPAQARFSDGGAAAWAERVSARRGPPHVRLGAALHSVRGVPAGQMGPVVAWAEENRAPLHFHLSEQPAENEACLAATGRTPAALLAEHGALGPGSTAIHATHVTGDDVRALGSSGTTVCLCPTTERSLADGVGPAAALRAAGSQLALGSDSHAVIDLFEEARAVELDERLVTNERGRNRPEELLAAATSEGMRSLGWPSGALAPGMLCDLVAVDLESPRLAGYSDEEAAAHAVFAATGADVTHVVVSGRPVVWERRHLLVEDVGAALRDSIAGVLP